MQAMEVEAGSSAQPQRVCEVHIEAFGLKAAVVAGVCLCLQTISGFWTVGNTGATSRAVQELGKLWDGGDGDEPSGTGLGPGDAVDSPSPAASGDAVACEGLYNVEGARLASSFERHRRSYKTDFLTFWTNPAKDSEVYMEFPLHVIKDEPLRLGIAVLTMKGPTAHFDARADGENVIFEFSRSADGSGVDVRRVDLRQRHADHRYDTIWSAGDLPEIVARLPIVATRRDQDSGGACHASAALAEVAEFLAVGMFALESTTAMQAIESGSRLELDTVKAFGGNLDFSMVSGVGVFRYCVFGLPTPQMPPRMADDRVGFFTTDFQLLGDYRRIGASPRSYQNIDPTVRMINRHWPQRRPDKKIHYYVDPTVPEPFQSASKEGVLRWKPAFAAVGLDIEAHTPADPDWPNDYDVADIRFNTISWAPGDGQQVFAIGQSVIDPRSGEILKANIIFTLGWLSGWLGEKLLYAVTAGLPMHQVSGLAMRRLKDVAGNGPRHADGGGDLSSALARDLLKNEDREKLHKNVCSYQGGGRSLRHHHPHEGSICRALHDVSPRLWWMLRERTELEADDFLRSGVADVTQHEVGHTLGLRHNFRGSTAVTLEQSQDPEYVRKNGFTASCMDYVPVNIAPGRSKDLPYFTPVIGAYDKWAIKYGYLQVNAEEKCCKAPDQVRAVASGYNHKPFTFATDEDADMFPIDPYTRRFDMTSKPTEWEQAQMQLATVSLKEFWGSYMFYGSESYKQVHKVLSTLLRKGYSSADNMAIFLGGIKTSRNHPTTGCEFEECKQQHVFAIAADELKGSLDAILDYIRSFPKDVDVDNFAKVAVAPLSVPMEDAGFDLTFLSFRPFDIRKTILTQKTLLLVSLLDSSRLSSLQFSESVRERSSGASPLFKSAPVSHFLQKVSGAVLGVKEGAAKDQDKEELKQLLRDPAVHDLQLDYLAVLKGAVQKSALHREPFVRAAVTGEMFRLHSVMEKAYKSVQDDAATLQDDMQIGALVGAMKALSAAIPDEA